MKGHEGMQVEINEQLGKELRQIMEILQFKDESEAAECAVMWFVSTWGMSQVMRVPFTDFIESIRRYVDREEKKLHNRGGVTLQ